MLNIPIPQLHQICLTVLAAFGFLGGLDVFLEELGNVVVAEEGLVVDFIIPWKIKICEPGAILISVFLNSNWLHGGQWASRFLIQIFHQVHIRRSLVPPLAPVIVEVFGIFGLENVEVRSLTSMPSWIFHNNIISPAIIWQRVPLSVCALRQLWVVGLLKVVAGWDPHEVLHSLVHNCRIHTLIFYWFLVYPVFKITF